jgi:hypothetical protein
MVATGRFRHQADLRKNRRQPLQYPAWIVLGPEQPPHKCMLSDVSNTGARITTGGDLETPPEFILFLSAEGKTRRKCRVVWRDGASLGVEFSRGP